MRTYLKNPKLDVKKVSLEAKMHYPYVIATARVFDREDKNTKDVSYYVNVRNPDECGTEVYQGPNYIEGSSHTKSYSRNYKQWINLPHKYLDVAIMLRRKVEDYLDKR